MSELDRNRALARVGGDVALLSELAGLFLEEYPRLFRSMSDGVQHQNPSSVIASAHQLKGLLGQFGAEGARAMALNIEMAARSGDLATLPGLMEELESALTRIDPELREMAAS